MSDVAPETPPATPVHAPAPTPPLGAAAPGQPAPQPAPAEPAPPKKLTFEEFLAANPEAAAEHRKRADAAAAKAVADKEAELARAAAEKDLSEAEKARAETKRERERAEAERKRADAAEVQLGFAQALVNGGHQLAGETAKDMLQAAAAKKIADAKATGYKLEWPDAIRAAISDSPFLVKPAAAPGQGQPAAGDPAAGAAAPQSPQNPPQGPLPTFAAPTPRPPAPARPSEPVDTSKLSPEALREYMQTTYGIG